VLYVKRSTRFQPYIVGGQQEQGRRAGTENVPYIIGLGRAAELAMASIGDENSRVRGMRDRLERGILRAVPKVFRNGPDEPRLPNTSNLAFEGVEAEAILIQLDVLGICASSGSACTSGSLEPSHVLKAMGFSPARARGSIRFSLGTYNTDEELDYLLSHLPSAIGRLRAIAA
jgi:cysteine desulfurase